MDDVVGIRVLDAKRGWVGFITWGRLWHPIDESELKAAVRRALPAFGLNETDEIRVCDTLQDLNTCPYFYEGLLNFAWQPPPFGDRYENWRAEKRAEMMEGRSIFCVGELGS